MFYNFRVNIYDLGFIAYCLSLITYLYLLSVSFILHCSTFYSYVVFATAIILENQYKINSFHWNFWRLVSQTRKNTTSLYNLNLIYFSYTSLFLAFTKEIPGHFFCLHKHGLHFCVFFQVCYSTINSPFIPAICMNPYEPLKISWYRK